MNIFGENARFAPFRAAKSVSRRARGKALTVTHKKTADERFRRLFRLSAVKVIHISPP